MIVISIVIATYNARQNIQNCLESLILQKNEKVELIIIDGGSTDGTLDIIRDNTNVINYWISEPDNGIYEAWNKGITQCHGDWIMFLGADDRLFPDAIASYLDFINSDKSIDQIDLISSRVQMIDSMGNPIRIKGWSFQWPLFLKEMTVAHVGALHSRKLFEKYGLFDTSYKIVGDYELLLRPGAQLKSRYLDKLTAIMSEGGVSDSVKSIREHYRAASSTGKYPKVKSLSNAIIVYLKFKLKHFARLLGFNIYMRKP